jgi:hypothetical protein
MGIMPGVIQTGYTGDPIAITVYPSASMIQQSDYPIAYSNARQSVGFNVNNDAMPPPSYNQIEKSAEFTKWEQNKI